MYVVKYVCYKNNKSYFKTNLLPSSHFLVGSKITRKCRWQSLWWKAKATPQAPSLSLNLKHSHPIKVFPLKHFNNNLLRNIGGATIDNRSDEEIVSSADQYFSNFFGGIFSSQNIFLFHKLYDLKKNNFF